MFEFLSMYKYCRISHSILVTTLFFIWRGDCSHPFWSVGVRFTARLFCDCWFYIWRVQLDQKWVNKSTKLNDLAFLKWLLNTSDVVTLYLRLDTLLLNRKINVFHLMTICQIMWTRTFSLGSIDQITMMHISIRTSKYEPKAILCLYFIPMSICVNFKILKK